MSENHLHRRGRPHMETATARMGRGEKPVRHSLRRTLSERVSETGQSTEFWIVPRLMVRWIFKGPVGFPRTPSHGEPSEIRRRLFISFKTLLPRTRPLQPGRLQAEPRRRPRRMARSLREIKESLALAETSSNWPNPHRHLPPPKPSPDPATAGFFRCFEGYAGGPVDRPRPEGRERVVSGPILSTSCWRPSRRPRTDACTRDDLKRRLANRKADQSFREQDRGSAAQVAFAKSLDWDNPVAEVWSPRKQTLFPYHESRAS